MAKSVKPDVNSMFSQMLKPEPVKEQRLSSTSEIESQEASDIRRIIEKDREDKTISSGSSKLDSVVITEEPVRKRISASKTKSPQLPKVPINEITEEGLMEEVYDVNKDTKRNENFLVVEGGFIDTAINIAKKYYGNNKSFYYRKIIAEDYLRNREQYEKHLKP